MEVFEIEINGGNIEVHGWLNLEKEVRMMLNNGICLKDIKVFKKEPVSLTITSLELDIEQ